MRQELSVNILNTAYPESNICMMNSVALQETYNTWCLLRRGEHLTIME